MKRLSDGDPATESHFLNYFSGLLAIKLRRRLNSSQDVDDLSQEVFLRVLRTLRIGDGMQRPERLGAYVVAVCNHVLLEHFRDQARTSQWDPDAPEPRHGAASAEQELISAETRLNVRGLLEELSAKDRAVLQAVFLEEQDKAAVCREYGITRDYLRVLLHRAKNRFRQLLDEQPKIKVKSATISGQSSQ